MKKIRNQKGITLIALVITIIVLLILASVSIAMISGDNGILSKAGEAKTKNEIANLKEQFNLLKINELMERYEGSGAKIETQKVEDTLNKMVNDKLITEDTKDSLLENGSAQIGDETVTIEEIAGKENRVKIIMDEENKEIYILVRKENRPTTGSPEYLYEYFINETSMGNVPNRGIVPSKLIDFDVNTKYEGYVVVTDINGNKKDTYNFEFTTTFAADKMLGVPNRMAII